MITQTPSPNKETPTKQREPLRWVIPAALLLLLLSICCVAQIVIVVLSPRNEASNLNLLSKDMADYSPWKLLLKFPPIAPGAAAAQAADRATETAQALLSPTPQLAANAPTSQVIVIEAPQNAPTTTPGSALITPQPTVTPRPAALGPTDTPVISTVPPVDTSIPTLVAVVPTTTETPRPLTFTPTPVGGSQPTRTSTPVPSTATNTPKPPDTSTPTAVRTPTRVPPPANTDTPVPSPANTDTPVPPPANTDTPVPPPATDTPAPPHNTNTPVPPPTRTNTPVPAPTATPTPVTQTPATPVAPTPTHTLTPTASNTTVPSTPTVTNTATASPTATNTATATATATQTNTPTVTPIPTCTALPNTLTIVKIEANNIYTQAAGQPIDFTICIINATTAPVSIKGITDTLPNTWQWANQTCDMSGNPNLACTFSGGVTGGSVAWGHNTLGQNLIMNPGDRIDLRIHGTYTATGRQCNDPVTPAGSGGLGYEVTLGDGTIAPATSAACIMVQ